MPRETRSVGHERGSTEFDRVANFSDAVYAIAMTLLVLEIGVPSLPVDPDSPRVMLDALNDRIPEIVSFAVSFLVIGQYWLNHHRLISKLQRVDRRFMSQTCSTWDSLRSSHSPQRSSASTKRTRFPSSPLRSRWLP